MQYLQLSKFIKQLQYEEFVKQPWLNNRSTPKKQMTLMLNVATKKELLEPTWKIAISIENFTTLVAKKNKVSKPTHESSNTWLG